jgi:hypothetical protein
MSDESGDDVTTTMHRYLRTERDQLLATIDGLGEYDMRRPMTPTGTNLLGILKHVASVQLGYFGETFGRPSGIVRELIDERAGHDDGNLPEQSAEWAAYRARLETAAVEVEGRHGGS